MPTRSSEACSASMRSSQPGLSSVASPSRRTTISPSACASARLSVSTMPVAGLRSRVKRSIRPDARQRSSTSTERSVEPSSTKISSKSGWVVCAASFSRNRSRTGSLFRFGTIRDTTAATERPPATGGSPEPPFPRVGVLEHAAPPRDPVAHDRRDPAQRPLFAEQRADDELADHGGRSQRALLLVAALEPDVVAYAVEVAPEGVEVGRHELPSQQGRDQPVPEAAAPVRVRLPHFLMDDHRGRHEPQPPLLAHAEGVLVVLGPDEEVRARRVGGASGGGADERADEGHVLELDGLRAP